MDDLLISTDLNNKKLSKSEIKDIILLSLLNTYCNTYNINEDNIADEFTKFKIINKSSLIKCTPEIKSKIIQLIKEIGKHNKDNEHIGKNFVIDHEIGYGAMGTVFKTVNLIDMCTYAIKKVPLESFDVKSLREVRNLSKLYHENIVRYHHTWIDTHNNINLYIQMELCDTTLKNIIVNKTLSYNELSVLFYKIVTGIDYIHKNNIIHRDIKPSNILIKNNIPKIADFGLSIMNNVIVKYDSIKHINCENMTHEIGTDIYASPEQLNSSSYNEKTDIYSLGIIYFEMLYMFANSTNTCDKNNIINELRDGIYDWCNSNINTIYQHIIKQMISLDINIRPSATEIKQYIENNNILDHA